jgi:hypothetical protein
LKKRRKRQKYRRRRLKRKKLPPKRKRKSLKCMNLSQVKRKISTSLTGKILKKVGFSKRLYALRTTLRKTFLMISTLSSAQRIFMKFLKPLIS